MKVVEEQALLRQIMAGELQARESTLETELVIVRRSQKALAQHPGAIEYRVTLHSLWQNEGESSVSATSRISLTTAIRAAERKFKKVNDRNDVQALYAATACIGKSRKPDFVWFRFPERLIDQFIIGR